MADVVYAAFLGLIAGLVPVYLGLAPLWFLKRLADGTRTWLVSFSTGILLFLFADVTHEGVQRAQTAGSATFVFAVLFALGLGLGLFGPLAVTHMRKRKVAPRGSVPRPAPPARLNDSMKLFTAQVIALGIGLHNLGEGLAIGAAYAAGLLGLTNVLVIGFALHNSTEGLGISGPIASLPTNLKQPLLLGFLAGFPTILGSMVGSFASSAALETLFFSAAAGALLYVIVELLKISAIWERTRSGFGGLLFGILLMFATGLLVS